MIDSFRGKYYFLSNFYPVEIEYDNRVWPSSEHAFQAMKSESFGEQEMIRRASTAAESKNMGRNVLMRPDWNDVRINFMKEILEAKFSIPAMRQQLLATNDEELVEGNTWNDTFWGVCNGVGLNWLGKLLMEVRMELQKNDRKDSEVL